MAGIYVGRRGARLATLDAALIVAALFTAEFILHPSAGFWVVREILVQWTGATAIVLTVHLLTFYVFELYNLRLDFRTFANVLRSVAARCSAATMNSSPSARIPTCRTVR